MLLLAAALHSHGVLAGADYPPEQFTDPERMRKLQSAIPRIDDIFREYAGDKKIPGMVWGLVIDDRVAHVGTTGVQNLESNAPVTPATVFRIASMTKSFTALAVLKLRDAGALSLDDRVARWIPEFARMELPTRDTAPLTIRELLSHSGGFPEDNPWGDQQLAARDADVTAWLRRGIPFSSAPGTRYEYSNYAFALLGRIITRASHVPYEKYMEREILGKLHMQSSSYEFSRVPREQRAVGYRLQTDGTYRDETPLPQGAFGSMGGLLTTAADLGAYIAFHLSAWPARDDPERGPVRRSSVREMSHLWTPATLTARRPDGRLEAVEAGYGFGLRVSSDCRFEHIVGHGGGLPGFGSYMAWLPDYGVGLFAMTNLTYAGPAEPISRAWNELSKSGGLQRRKLPASPVLIRMHDRIADLWASWDDGKIRQIAAMNLLLDEPLAERRSALAALRLDAGECSAPGPVMAENWLRGQFNIECQHGTVGVFFTLAPTQPPAVQYLSFRRLESPTTKLAAPTGAPAGVTCTDP